MLEKPPGGAMVQVPAEPGFAAIPAKAPGTRVEPALTLYTSRLCHLNIIEGPQMTAHGTDESPSQALPEFLTHRTHEM